MEPHPPQPAALVDPPKVRKEEIKPLDPEQARTLLRIASETGDRHEALYVLSLAAGLPMGEALGLKWSDVDLAGGTLRVNRQLQRMRRHKDEGKPGRLVFSEPKNASRRTVDLPQRAIAALKRHRKRQLEEKLGAGGSYKDSGLVFATSKGHRSTRRTSSTAISSPCSSEQDCPIFAGMISGTRASLCF